MAPFVRDKPEESWTRGRDQGSIPLSLFELYRRANYLSFGSAPPFLKDGENILFSYFCMMLRSLALSLTDADQESKEFLRANRTTYYPGKLLEDPTWTKEKTEATSRHADQTFRNLLISLLASLDVLSEIIAVYSQGTIKNLEVGRAQFSSIETWLRVDYKPPAPTTTPSDTYLDELHAKLRPIIHCQPPESEWLPYMRMLRNKAAHLGSGPFRYIVLHGNDGAIYTFIPREWPYIWEKDINSPTQQQPTSTRDFLLKTLIHQDVVEYALGALRKVNEVISEACGLTADAYTKLSHFSFNQKALEEIKNNTKEFGERYANRILPGAV